MNNNIILISMIEKVQSAFNCRLHQVDLIFLDFQKAFESNTVPHQRLLKKLHHYGIYT